MKDIFNALLQAEQAQQMAADLSGRSFGVSLAIVADIQDPYKLGRVRVMLPSKGAKTLSDWLLRLTPSKLISQPLVNVGDTVVVSFVNGDPSQGVYLGVVNNIPQPPAEDRDSTVFVNGETVIIQTAKDVTLVAGSSVVKLTSNGTLEITGVSSATINGKQIATVDAVDNDGDRIVNKGW